MCFERADDPHRSIDLRPGKQIRKIPPRTLAVPEQARQRNDVGEQTGGILQQVSPFILEYGERVFAVSQKKVEKRRGGVKRIGEHQIERARIGADHPFQQTQGGGDFIFSGSLRFMIQHQT